ncbi:hypothetical protein JM18_008267 [Phytophthora kernoviae]|uniref:Necrosis inducing-like protein NPP1 type n=1 Tax=Phytophthora kernoviae TaxID=325452 RepID=A0A8T0LPJ7_9STRA|nr:hypothetical protein JM16_008284 [Phytophthora kernoviae]KAG2514636.1 hypothetical protein JM18_008267 [Phytophthora kernoviae]
MNLRAFIIAAVVSLAAVHAEINTISHDQVQPFAQPEPVSDAEKAAVKFKPQLAVTYGCDPYPAVDSNGSISAGLKWAGKPDGDCTGSPLGSQVYSRADWYEDKWAIMYAWYFPKARQRLSKYFYGHRHMWQWAVVWIDDPASDNSTVQGVSMSASVGYQKRSPPKSKYVDDSSVKLDSYVDFWWSGKASLRLTEDTGETQDLIQWDQLTDAARESLSSFDFDEALWNTKKIKMPLKDGVFTKNLKSLRATIKPNRLNLSPTHR